jgi:chloramphenicol 3-O-phosphotransferase
VGSAAQGPDCRALLLNGGGGTGKTAIGRHRPAGARFIVVAGVVEHAALRKSYAECLAGCDVQMARLVTSAENVRERTRTGDRGPCWNLREAIEQQAELERARVEDFVVANDRPVPEVAREILIRAGWPV